MKLSLIIYGCRSLDSVPHSAAHRPSVGTQRLYQLEHHISLLCSKMAPGLGLLLGKNTQSEIVFHMWATGSRETRMRGRKNKKIWLLGDSRIFYKRHEASKEKHGNIIDLSQKIYSHWGWFEIEKKWKGGGRQRGGAKWAVSHVLMDWMDGKRETKHMGEIHIFLFLLFLSIGWSWH
jgi:hypothetical protein